MRLINYRPQLVPWSSFDRLSSLTDLLDSAFQPANSHNRRERAWSPALEIREDAEKVTVSLEAAGLKKEDFEISLQDDSLTISGERKNETETREGESYRSERFFGRFSRSIALSTPVNADAVAATYVDGVLTVTLPKVEAVKPRKITVG